MDTIGRVQIGELGFSLRHIAWQAKLTTARPGAVCYCLPNTREILIDPDATTAGLLLEIREESSPGSLVRFARPGDVIRFSRPRSSFFVYNALAALATAAGVTIPQDAANLQHYPAGFLRILCSTAAGAFIPHLGERRTAQPMAARWGPGVGPGNGSNYFAFANAGDGTRCTVLLGVGFQAFRVACYPITVANLQLVRPCPADLAVTARLHVLGAAITGRPGGPGVPSPMLTPFDETNPYDPVSAALANVDSGLGILEGFIHLPNAELDLTFGPTQRVHDLDASAGAVVLQVENLTGAATGATGVLITAEGY